MNDQLIILIGGPAGAGKTTVSRYLCQKYDINHRLGSGFIREIVKSFISKNKNPFLYNYSFKCHDPNYSSFDNLFNQSKSMLEPMESSIKRAFNEGTSLIIEGVNVIPGMISEKHISKKIVLYVENEEFHRDMVLGKTHSKRKISNIDFSNIRIIQDNFIERARKNNWELVDTTDKEIAIKNISKIIEG